MLARTDDPISNNCKMSLQEFCEMGTADLHWMKSTASNTHIVGPCSPSTTPTVNKLTNTTTSLRPMPDPSHCVQQLRALLSSRPDIGFLRTDTDFLLRFLKVRNFQVASAFQLLCGYYCYRQRERELFKTTISGPGVQAALADGVVGVLPERDACGSSVMVILASNCDEAKCGLTDIWGAVLLSLESLSAREEEAGVVCVVDWSDCPSRLNADLSPKALRLVLDGLQDAFPLRMSALHLLNVPWWSSTALKLCRSFIKEKARSKIHVHGGNNMSSLHKSLPPRLLPAQLGGEKGEYSAKVWSETITKDRVLKPKTEENDDEEDGRIIKSAMESILRKAEIARNEKIGKSIAINKDIAKIDESKNIKNDVDDSYKSESCDEGFKESTDVEDNNTNENTDNDNDDEDEEEQEKKTTSSLKSFTLDQLIRPGMRRFQLAQMTEDSEGSIVLKKLNKSPSVDEKNSSNNNNSSPKFKESTSSIFNFSKSKSFSFSLSNRTDKIASGNHANEVDVEESESIYNFTKPKTSSTSFATSFTNSFTTNMNKIGVNIRNKDGGGNYECANNLLSNDIH